MFKRSCAFLLSVCLAFGTLFVGAATAEPGPPSTQEIVLNGFENVGEWVANNSDIAVAADTVNKSEGTQAENVTFSVPDPAGGNAWREVVWDKSASAIDLSAATELKFDIRPVGTQTASDHEPLRFKLVDAVGGVVFEDALPLQTADQWNTFTLDLSSIPAANRSAITYIVFYVWNGDGAIAGRTSLQYELDNLRITQPSDSFVESVVNGFENMSEWEGTSAAADTTNKTEGAQSADVTYAVPSPAGGNAWVEYRRNATANPLDFSSAQQLKFDIRPVGTQTAGGNEPIIFKLVDAVGGVIFEDALPVQTANQWNTFTLDLSSTPAADRSAITYMVFYIWNGDASIGGRSSLRYEFDNIRITTNQVQPVTAVPSSSTVLPGTEVSLSTSTAGAVIYYTLDGSDPRTSGTRTAYNDPIIIQDATSLKTYAEVDGKPKSSVTVYQYTIGTGVQGEDLYTLSSGVADVGNGSLAGIGKTTAIGADGFVSDWNGQARIVLPSNPGKQVQMSGWQGNDDTSAEARVAYDDANLYLHVKVKDDKQSDFSGDAIWMGDSVQVAFSKDGAAYGPEYGFSYGQGTPSKFSWNSGSAKLGIDSVKFKSVRDAGTKETTYDIVIPWLAALPALPVDKVPFTLLINDNDGAGRKGYIEWTPGIGNGKDASSLGTLFLLKASDTWGTAIDGPQAALQNTPYDYSLILPNFGDTDADFALSVPAANLTIDHLIVPAGKVLKKAVQVTFPSAGNQEVKAVVTDNSSGISKSASIQATVTRDAAGLTAALDALQAKLPVLESLLAKNKAKRIPTDYETVNYTVIKNFIAYGRDDIANGYLTRADYVVNELNRLYDEASANLSDYLSGKKKAMAVPEYVTARSAIDGFSFIGPTKTSVSKDIDKRPIFFTGYGHFNQAKADVPQFNDYGANIIQIELGPDGTVLPPAAGSSKDYSISKSVIQSSIIPTLESAAKNNVAVSLLLSPHYFPGWAMDKWPDLKNANPGFLNYNINAPRAKEIVEAFLKTIVPMVKDYPSLHSIILSNEPQYDTRTDTYAVAPWHGFLKDKYRAISKLNDNYGSHYASFNDVAMPSAQEATPLYMDWTNFNNAYFSSWHEWMAGIIKKLAPKVPVSAKIMANLNGASTYGVDPEDFSKFTDLNGDDNWNYLGSGTGGFLRENRYYDLQGSLHKAPVFNSETHIILDRDTMYSPAQAQHAEASLWQSAIHGKSASAIWVWERSYDTSSAFYGSVLERPDVVQTIGTTSLNLNRLSYEVTAFQNIKPDAAILYSLPSMVYNGSYAETLDRAYEALAFNGQKAGFVSEAGVQKGDLRGYKLLIVPNATNVEADTLKAIKAFVAGGGKVIVVGESSLSADENAKPLNASIRSYILSHATTVSVDALTQTVGSQLASLGLMKVVLKDADTGLPASGVEWQSVEYKGKLLIDIANYDPSSASKNLVIEVNGRPIGVTDELIDGGKVDGRHFNALLEKPYLLSVDMKR
ncbi:sugar-binding protein [Paenibacillus albus]|uniref:beta-galactosidase n=1 Tax=Paenibacillus albus TaxID=2495582 RepID=A0A3S9A6M2_9BACL|nr:sugar-binding protein [Paenibacillus albus]AZN41326.1 hypothetical protein EJC50_17850 [Paenibacillus albus]